MPDYDAADRLQAARARAPVTDRVNVEPSILHGMNVTEAKFIAGGSFVLFAFIGGVIASATGWWQALLLMALMGPILTLWFGSKYLARLKRGRSDGYYSQALHLWLVGRGYVQPKFITHHGWWSLGRTLDFSLASRFDPPPERFTDPDDK